MKDVYKDDFYRTRQEKTQLASNLILDRLLQIIPPPASAVDVGCGVGVWLANLRARAGGGGISVQGVDGPWVNREFLLIEEGEFLQHDLSEPIDLGNRFDLAISLEVAEHLPCGCADQFVENLISLSDFVLFSAAPPLQGGTNHINEQPIEYWVEKFEQRGYVAIDCLRPYIWNDDRIVSWYRQNIMLAVKASRVGELVLPKELLRPNGYLQPDIFLKKIEEAYTAKGAWKLLRRAVKRNFKSAFSGS